MAMASDHLRRALQDGRAVLAGGPGLGSQMILLRNDAASMAQQHLQGNAGSDEAHYPLQGFAENYDDPNRKASTDAGVSGPMSLDPNRGGGIMPSAPSIYAHSAISPGLGFQNVDYPHQDVPGMQNLMQAYAYTQSNPEIASNVQSSLLTGGGEQGYSLQNYGNVPSTEMTVNTERHVGQEAPPGGVSAPAGAVNHFQGNVMEDSRRLAMVHEFGNGSVAYSHQATPHFQSGYHHPGKAVPVLVDQASPQNPIYPWVQETELELQRMRELQSQIIWKRQLEMELQRQNPQPQELNIRQRYARIPARMTRGNKYSRLFQKSGMKKRPKLPPLAGPEGPGWCNICQADCNTAEILQQHIAGKKHQKKLLQADKEGKDAAENPKQITTVDKKSTYLQSKSELGLNDESPESCLGPRKHDVNAEEPTVEPPAKKPHLSDEIGIPQEPQTNQKLPLFHEICNICDVACNSQLVLDAHLKGKRHAANAKKLGAGVRSIYSNRDLKSKRSEIQAEISGKTSNLGSVEGTAKALSNTVLDQLTKTVGDPGKGMSDTVKDQPTKFVEDSGKGMSNTVEDQPTILKDTAVIPDNPIASVEEDNTFTKDPEPQSIAQEQPCGGTPN